MHGASLQDWLQVLQAEVFRLHVYVFDPESHSVFHPGKELLPWDVALLLGRFHKKFRWSRGMNPQLRDIMKCVDEFCTKLQWQWVLRGSGSRVPFRVPRSPAFNLHPPVTLDVAPELRCWTSFFSSQLRRACARALSRNSRRNYLWRNRLPLDTMAMHWLRQSPWAVVPTDKDGGYCLVSKHYLSLVHQEILAKKWYEPYPRGLFPTFRNLAKEYTNLARKVAILEGDENMARAMQQSLAGGEQHVVRQLNVTVKSHKPAGHVTFRNIHGGAFYPFAGLGAWLAHNLQKSLRMLPHILRNTSDLVTQLAKFQSSSSFVFVKVDIKDYFMSGTREELRQCGSELLHDEIRDVGKEVIDFLLSHQYVRSEHFPQSVWQVIVGTGMGLNFSGELSDAAFYAMAERWMMDNPGTFDSAGILGYWRFKDDILVVVKQDHLSPFKAWYEHMKEKSGSFKLEVETVNQDQATFLDLDLHVQTRKGVNGEPTFCIAFEPHFKKTSLGVPLSHTSSHPWHVHASWPFAELRRLRRLSSNFSAYDNARQVFVSRLIDNFSPSVLTNQLLLYCPPVQTVLCWEGCTWIREGLGEGEKPHSPQTKWLVLPFHFVWESACLTSVANKFLRSHEAQLLWSKAWGTSPDFKIGIAWKSTFPPVATRLKNI